MKYLLSETNTAVLEELARAPGLLAFDFDGTLAPIVRQAEEAQMRSLTRTLLREVSELYPCAVISGRGLADVQMRLDGANPRHVMGNHGLEPGQRLEMFARQVSEARPLLEQKLASYAGIELEDKRYSLSLHYRKSRHRRAAVVAIREAVAALPSRMRMMGGKLVVNVVPAHAPHKGDALRAIKAQEGADLALYVGDDVTDEDVFRLHPPDRIVTVRVGASRSSAATYYLEDQGEVDTLLSRLVALRQAKARSSLPQAQ